MTFLQRLSYRQKNRLLILISVIFLFMVYFLAIKKTIVKYSECKELEIKANLAMNAPTQLVSLEKDYDAMKKSTENYAGTNIQQPLLGVVSRYCNENGLVIRDFSQPITSTNNDVTIETNSFVLEGSFIRALRLVYNLEQVNKIGRVASLDFSLKKDYATKSNSLATTVYIQNIKKESNEK